MTLVRYLIYLGLLIPLCCLPSGDIDYEQIAGETMGTYYKITYRKGANHATQQDFTRLLARLNGSLSTYEKQSVISRFNRSAEGMASDSIDEQELAEFFYDNLMISDSLFHKSQGNFDPTVMPLVNYWGFGYTGRQQLSIIDTLVIDSLLSFVGFDKLTIQGNREKWSVRKSDNRIQLDFSAVAKGYAIDVLSQFLEDSLFVNDYLVDIGGEARAKGVNKSGHLWRIGINSPLEESSPLSFDLKIDLQDRSIATSGNYRNYYELDGQIISHTISPHTGFFERNDLMSVSILTTDCAVADGVATTCMTLGFEHAKRFVQADDRLEAVFIYLDSAQQIKQYLTPRLGQFVQLPIQ